MLNERDLQIIKDHLSQQPTDALREVIANYAIVAVNELVQDRYRAEAAQLRDAVAKIILAREPKDTAGTD